MSSARQPDDRQLLQPPQPWTGFDNPQWMCPPPPYEGVAPSAPPITLPAYYDQVPGDVQPTSQQLQRPLVVSSPVIVNTSTSVNVGAVPPSSSRPPTGCCGLSNKTSSLFILYVLLVYSGVAVFASVFVLADGVSHGFTAENYIAFTFTLPSAFLFPGSFSALNGVFNGQTVGIALLLNTLNVYWVLVFLMAIGSFCVALASFVFFPPLSAILFVCLLFQLAFLSAVSHIHKVLVDFRLSSNRRRSACVP